MKPIIQLALAITITASMHAQKNSKKITYPSTQKIEHMDTYFETKINDPYRWLEDDKSSETANWVTQQNKLTYSYLDKIPYRTAIKERMEKLWNYEKISAPFKEGNFTYFYKNNGLQNQSVLYRKDASGNEEVFLDPNLLSKDGTTSLGDVSFSKDGSLVAFAISEGGSDWRKVVVWNAITKEVIGETLVDVKFSGIAWFKNQGFYYSSYDKPKGSELSAITDQHKLYFHQLGTSQKEDKVIFGADFKRRYINGSITNDENYLIISAANSTTGNELYYKDLSVNDSKITALISNFDSSNSIIENNGTTFYLETNYNAANNRVVTFNLSQPAPENWTDFIPETENVLNATTGAGYIFANYIKDALSYIKQYNMEGKLVRDVQLPGIGTVGAFGGKKSEKTLYYSFTNYITPGATYSFDAESGLSSLYKKPIIDFNSENYVSEQVFYTSKDGTKIPMIITYKKGLKRNGTNPTILYGYGGFNISLTPSFSIANAVWLENNGIYAVANLRGGGEYGKKWHDAGTQKNKQNVFDDFIAAAEFLISEKYTSSNYLAIKGGSNGGLLVGAIMTQRPTLMKVALPAVGVLDMLRYHTFTAGAGWAYDYGTAQDSKEMFDYLKGYSPVHNVKEKVQYPATLVTTGDHDDRVVPAHSFKFAATLQEKQTGNNPTLIRIDVNAGHGAGKSLAATIQENADIQAFTLFNMGILKISF